MKFAFSKFYKKQPNLYNFKKILKDRGKIWKSRFFYISLYCNQV